MADKILKTKIKLLIRTYEEWIGDHKDDVLLKGEVGFCTIENKNQGNVQTAPTVLFKVGTYDGVDESTKKTFEQLKWASALAADVYDWAKAEDVVFENQHIYFKKADGSVVKDLNLADFVTDGELTTKLANYYTKTEVDGLVDGVKELINALDDSITTVAEGTGINVTDAGTGNDHAYTVALDVDGAKTALGLDTAAYVTVDSLNATAKGYADAVLGTSGDADTANTIYGAKAAAAKALTDAKAHAEEKVNALANGAVAANATAIGNEVTRATEEEARLAGLIADNTTAIGTEKTRAEAEEARIEGLVNTEKGRAEEVEADLDERIAAIEADYLVEADKEALQEQITANANAITAITDGVDPDKIDSLKDLVAWADEHAPEVATIKGDIEALADRMDTAENDIDTLEGRMDDAEDRLDAIEALPTHAITADDIAKWNNEIGAKALAETKTTTAEVKTQIEAYGYATEADLTLAEGRLDALEALPSHGITAGDIANWNGEIGAKELAGTKLNESTFTEYQNAHAGDYTNAQIDNAVNAAKDYADGLAVNYATAAQGTKADNALQEVEVGTGLKVSAKADNKQKIEIDDEVVFILDCNF